MSCRGCGLRLPASAEQGDRRLGASGECRARYDRIVAFELSQPLLAGRRHQTTVDAYTAQHAGPPSKPLAVAFALIGLEMVLERGHSGLAVREAHP